MFLTSGGSHGTFVCQAAPVKNTGSDQQAWPEDDTRRLVFSEAAGDLDQDCAELLKSTIHTAHRPCVPCALLLCLHFKLSFNSIGTDEGHFITL